MPYRGSDRLGPLVREHRASTASAVGQGVGGAAMIGFAGLTAWSAPSSFVMLACAAFLGVVGAAALLSPVVGRKRRIGVHARGLRLVDGRKEVALHWDEIESVTSHMTRRSGVVHHHHRIRGPGGEIAFGTGIEKVADLAATVEREVFPRVSRRAEESLAAGQSVAFGPIVAEPAGLRHDERLLPWSAVESCGFDFGRLVVRSRSGSRPWTEVEAKDVPNAPVLVRIVETRIG